MRITEPYGGVMQLLGHRTFLLSSLPKVVGTLRYFTSLRFNVPLV